LQNKSISLRVMAYVHALATRRPVKVTSRVSKRRKKHVIWAENRILHARKSLWRRAAAWLPRVRVDMAAVRCPTGRFRHHTARVNYWEETRGGLQRLVADCMHWR